MSKLEKPSSIGAFQKTISWLVIVAMQASMMSPAMAAIPSGGVGPLRGDQSTDGFGGAGPRSAAVTSGEKWERMAELLKKASSATSVPRVGLPSGLAALDFHETTQLADAVLRENTQLAQAAVDTEQQFANDALYLQRHNLHPDLASRHQATVEEFRSRLTQFQTLALQLDGAHRANDDSGRRVALESLGKFTAKWENAKSFRPISREAFARDTQKMVPGKVEVSVGSLNAKTAVVTALAKGAPTSADLAETPDIALTPQIRELAQSLQNNPVKIYNWVHDNIDFQPTYGSIQGAALSLLNRRGNATDNASLLIALLRAANIPARYTYGSVQVPIDQAKNWVGGVATNDQVAELMTKGGIPTSSVISAGSTVAVRFDHIWVEAYVDYYPSRGAVNRTANTWVPLDASFKQYTIAPPVNLQAVPFDANTVVNQMVASGTRGAHGSLTGVNMDVWNTAYESHRLAVADHLAANRPGTRMRDLLGTKAIVPAQGTILPGSLPYRLVTAGGNYSSLPDSLRHILKLTHYASDADYRQGNGTVVYSLPLSQVGISTIGVDYVPASPADVDAFAQARRDNAETLPAYLINVIPQVQIEGVAVATAPAVRLGTTQYWSADITDPRGVLPPSYGANRITAGSHVAFVVDPAGVTPEMVQQRLDLLPKNAAFPIREGLQQAGLQYWMMRDHLDQFAAAQFNGRVMRMPSVGAFTAPMQVTYSFGVPRNGFFNGYQTDIKHGVYAAVNNSQQDQMLMFTQIGTVGSALESGIWEILFGRKVGSGVTASGILATANEQRIPVYIIDQSNVTSIMPLLQLSADAKQEIGNAVAAGKRAIVPEREVDLGNWKGAGYVIQDPVTGAGVYQIDGGLSGGLLIGCILKALLENCLFQKFLSKHLRMFLDRLTDRAMKSALLAAAGTVMPMALAVGGQVMWLIAFHQAIIEFSLAMAEGEFEGAIEAAAALALCSLSSPCALPKRRGGPLTKNPVMIGSGQKFEVANDYAAAGAFPLRMTRTYMSFVPQVDGSMGRKWRHSYERSIVLPPPTTGTNDSGAPTGSGYAIGIGTTTAPPASLPANPPAPEGALAMRGDGGIYQFTYRAGAYRIDNDTPEQLTRQSDASGRTTGWTYYNTDDEVETYNADGKLTSITNRAGAVQTLTYTGGGGKLGQVRDPVGRTLTFAYNAAGQLETVTDPAGGIYRYGYNADDVLISVTFADQKTRQYLYEGGGKAALLTGILDENSNRYATYRYDYQNRVVEEFHAGGVERMTLAYQGELKTVVTDALGTARTYEFTKLFQSLRLAKVTEPCATCGSGSAAETTYDAHGFVASETDFNGHRTVYVNDSRGQVTSKTEAAGSPVARTVGTHYDGQWRVPVTMTEPTSVGTRTTVQNLDGRGNIKTRAITVGAETRTTVFDYNAFGQVTRIDGARSDVADITTFSYPAGSDQLAAMQDAAGNVTTYADYDGHGRPKQMTDANGLITTLNYDARGRLKSSSAGGETTGYDYDGVGNLDTLTLPDSTFLKYGYDAAQRLTSITDSAGNKVIYTLDAQGNRKAEDTKDVTGQLAQTLTRVFDGLARLKEARGGVNPAAQLTQYSYDSQGNLKTSTDPLSHVTVNDYDELNRLKKVTEPLLAGQSQTGNIQYGYDPQDNLASVTDQRGLSTGYNYSGFNELKRLTSPDTGATDYTYDAAGNVKTLADSRGQNASYNYDALNRLKSLTYSDETLAFTYGEDNGAPATSTNSKGRLAKLTDGSGNTVYAYDLQGRVTEKRQTVITSGGSQTGTTKYGYNAAGQLQTLTTPSNQIVEYGYGNNQITSIKVNGQNVLTGASYFPFGEVKGWTWGNGQSYLRSYDLDGRVQSVTLGNQTRTYGFDDASRITGLTDKQGTTTTASVIVGYDNLDRLTSAAKTGTSGTPFNQAFGYDLIGNRTSQTVEGIASTLNYATTSNRLMGSAAGSMTTTYSYDNAGNIIGDGTFTYGYSGRSRLTEVKQGASTIASYKHNGFGERMIKTVSGNTTIFGYDEDGHLLGEYDQAGNLIQETVWLDETPVATLRPTTSGQAISQTNPLKVYLVWADHLDTPRVVTTNDAASSVVWTWDSDPFGTTQAAGSINYSLRFPGQYFDAETQTHYNYFRDYNPQTGRYQQSDPIGLLGGVNTFAYVFGAPLSFKDDDGLAPRINLLPPPGGTYVLRDPCSGEVVKTGRTNKLKRRKCEYERDKNYCDFTFEEDIRTKSKNLQRGRAQALNSAYKPRLDKIRDISINNDKRPIYEQAACDCKTPLPPKIRLPGG